MAHRWLFTAKSGEVKKRTSDRLSRFQESFLKHGMENGGKLIALSRDEFGQVGVADLAEYKNLMSNGFSNLSAVQVRRLPVDLPVHRNLSPCP